MSQPNYGGFQEFGSSPFTEVEGGSVMRSWLGLTGNKFDAILEGVFIITLIMVIITLVSNKGKVPEGMTTFAVIVGGAYLARELQVKFAPNLFQ
jgi:hypothetical protein